MPTQFDELCLIARNLGLKTVPLELVEEVKARPISGTALGLATSVTRKLGEHAALEKTANVSFSPETLSNDCDCAVCKVSRAAHTELEKAFKRTVHRTQLECAELTDIEPAKHTLTCMFEQLAFEMKKRGIPTSLLYFLVQNIALEHEERTTVGAVANELPL